MTENMRRDYEPDSPLWWGIDPNGRIDDRDRAPGADHPLRFRVAGPDERA